VFDYQTPFQTIKLQFVSILKTNLLKERTIYDNDKFFHIIGKEAGDTKIFNNELLGD
jgi:hypothetical protein